MARLTLKEKVRIFLHEDNKEKRFSSPAIAKELFNQYNKEYEGKKKLEQLAAEVSAVLSVHRDELKLSVITSSTPKEFYFTDQGSENVWTKNNKQTEKDLYALVQQYLKYELKVYSKVVAFFNKKGPTKNEWLHPDIVGIENLTSRWKNEEVKKLASASNSKKARLWSIEVKCDVDKNSVRQNYFQAVANSSWANFGYLAVGDIKDMEADEELCMLADLYGIGVMKINIGNPLESKILIPAKEREIDMVACSRLAEANDYFKGFIKKVHNFHLTQEIGEEFWKILEISEDAS